jgi:hypothetical protein
MLIENINISGEKNMVLQQKYYASFILSVIAIMLMSYGCTQTESDDGGEGGPAPIAVTFESVVQTGGTSGTSDSTGLILTFDVDPTTMTADNITVTGATKNALSGSGTTRTLSISKLTVDNNTTVSISISNPSGYAISGSSKTAVVYRKVYNLRDSGPAGGLIFYDKGSYSDGWRYLEAAPDTTEWTIIQFGKKGTEIGGTLKDIGKGKENTDLIVQVLNAPAAETDRAAQLCYNLIHGGYDDWFLPSQDELKQMYTNLKEHGVGNFTSTTYWSSSEFFSNPDEQAWIIDFTSGDDNLVADKDANHRVRAARRF